MRPIATRPRNLATSAAAAVAAAALVIGAIVGAQPAAAVSTTVSLAGVQPTGIAGIPQALSIIGVLQGSSCLGVLPPTATVYGDPGSGSQPLGTAQFAGCNGSQLSYTYQWIPSSATVYYLTASLSGGGTSSASRSAISPVPVVTTVAAPETVKLGAPITISATATAAGGSIFSPQGTMTFTVSGQGAIGTVALNQAIPSVAQIQWIPSTLGAFSVTATYTPANVGQPSQNAACGQSTSCTSVADTGQVTSTGVNIYLANPPGYSAGFSSLLTAVVSVVPPSGTVTFLVNGAVLAANVPVASNGQAQTRWTPPAPGQFVIKATWNNSTDPNNSAQETVSVGTAPPQNDQIIIVTGAGTTLTNGATYSVGNGTTITFSSSTASGSPVTFSTTGTCKITGTTFTTTQGNGTCAVKASSAGGNGYGPATASATVNLVPGTQTAKLAAPQSGKVNVGKTITLEKENQGKTNIGKPITWKITQGKGSICSLVFPSNGAVKLKISKKGYCTVKASAPGVSGQWAAFSLVRKYQGI